MKLKKVLAIIFACLLVGCSSTEEMTTGNETTKSIIVSNRDHSQYQVIVPINMNESREYHEQHANSSEDFTNMGNCLMEMSKEYFPTDSYVLGEGQVITYNILQKLIKRESSTNEIGLNPSRDTKIPSGSENVEIINPVLVSDVIEQDYYKRIENEYQLAGISLALFMDPFQDAQTGDYVFSKTLSDDIMFEYGSTMARKLERYMRTLDASKRVPILITLYVKGEAGSYLPGRMIGKGYFVDRSPTFERLHEAWYLLPSTEAKEVDGVNYAQFITFRTGVTNFIKDDVGIVGYGFYQEGNLQQLDIQIKYKPKTYVEYVTIVTYAAELLNNFVNDTFDIKIEFKTLYDTTAIVMKNSNTQEIQIIYLN